MNDMLKRRDFLGTGLTAMAALQMGTSVAGAAENETMACCKTAGACCGGTQIGMILYTIRDAMKTPDDIARSLEKVKKIGYNVVELTGVDGLESAKLAEMLKQNELCAVSAHASWAGLQNDLQKVIDWYQEVGCNHLVLSVTPDEYRTEEGYSKFAKIASEIGCKLSEAGMSLGYHNHSFEFVRFNNNKTGMDLLFEAGDPKSFNFEIDTYWIQHGGADPAAWIKKVASRVPTIHMKDMQMVDGKQIFAEVGEGNMNWCSVIEAGKAAGVKYYIVEQDVCRRDPFESVAISLKNMKAMGLV